VRLPVATKARIKALAAKAGVSASEIVRRRFVEK
jgi:predicted DNA-binding protein